MTAGDRLRALADEYDLDVVYAFGSRAAEALRALESENGLAPQNPSDLDIGVLPRVNVHLDAPRRADLTIAIERIYGVARADVVILPEASVFLAAEVVSGELLFARDADREAEYQLYVLRRANDLAPFERERQAFVLEGGR